MREEASVKALFYTVFLGIQTNIACLKIQGFAHCPSGKCSIRIKMSLKHWCNANDR